MSWRQKKNVILGAQATNKLKRQLEVNANTIMCGGHTQ